MTRLVVIIVIVVLVVWLLRRAIKGPRRGSDAGDGPRSPPEPTGEPKGDLVNCAHCNVNLPKAEARSAGGRFYCSEEHWRLGPRDG